jgi:hypothetical protein
LRIRHPEPNGSRWATPPSLVQQPSGHPREGYEGSYKQIAAELVEIVRLRGLYNKPDRWETTIETVWKAFKGLNGAVTPHSIIQFLTEAGDAAREWDDEGFTEMLAMLAVWHKEGRD